MLRIIPAFPLISLLLAAILSSAETESFADEPVSTLPPRTIPYGQPVLPGLTQIDGVRSSGSTRLVGIARPAQFAELSVSVSSPIARVEVRTGDRVKAGDVLVRLDDRIPQAALKAAQLEARRTGALMAAMARLQLAEQQLQRAVIAMQRQAGSQFEVDEKTASRDEARAQVTIEQESLAAANARLERAQAELAQYTIVAPFDGEVVQVHQKAGPLVDRSNPVLTIADRCRLNVELNLPLTEFGSVKVDSRLPLLADLPVGTPVAGRVTAVSPYINSASRTFRIELEIDNTNEQFPAGFTVRQPETELESDGLAQRPAPPQGRAQR